MNANKNEAKKIAVENFLGTLGDLTTHEAIANLNMDAKLYKWNAATVKAILDGILARQKVKS